MTDNKIEVDGKWLPDILGFAIQTFVLIAVGAWWTSDINNRLNALELQVRDDRGAMVSVVEMRVRQEDIISDVNKLGDVLERISQQISRNTVILEQQGNNKK